MFPQTRYQKVTDPELQCPDCEGYGWKKETQKLAMGSKTTESDCQTCNCSGEDPSKKPMPVKLTPREIEYILRAVTVVKDQLGETSEDDESREVFQRLFAKFSELTK